MPLYIPGQTADAELLAIAALTSAADQMPYFTGSGTASLATVTTAARTVLDDTSTGAMVTTLGAALNSDLTAHINDTLKHPAQLGLATMSTTFGPVTASSATDVTGLSLTGVVVGSRPLKITLSVPHGLEGTVISDTHQLMVLRGSTVVGSLIFVQPNPVGAIFASTGEFSDNPSAGTYNYKVQVVRLVGTGTAKLSAVTTGYNTMPTLRIEEVAA